MLPHRPRARLPLLAAALLALPTFAAAQAVVACASPDYQYHECKAEDLYEPQLVYQASRAPCIVNRTWGFDRYTGMLWVDQGCVGRFANVGGYHHGKSGQYDSEARRYSKRGDDVGAFVGGAAWGAFLGGSAPAPSGDAAEHPDQATNAPETANPIEPAEQGGRANPPTATAPLAQKAGSTARVDGTFSPGEPAAAPADAPAAASQEESHATESTQDPERAAH